MSAYKTSVLVIMVMMVASCSNTPTTISKPQDHFSLNSSSPIGGYVDLAQQGVGAEARFILCDYNDEQCISKRSAKHLDQSSQRRIQPIPMQLDIDH